MENGSFEKACEELHDLDFIDSSVVPLPNQIPQSIEPVSTKGEKRSSAIEALITQNEDLMSRLAVNIRRNGLLEEKIESLTESFDSQKKVAENLKDQLLILKRKDQLISGRHDSAEKEQKALSNKIEFLEQKYIEYYNSTESLTEGLREDIKTAQSKIRSLKKYRLSVKPLAQKMRTKLQSTEVKNLELENQNHTFKEQISKSVEHIQHLSKEHEQRISELTLEYSNEIQAVSHKLQEVEEKNRGILLQLDKLKNAFDENVELKNEVIQLKRENHSIKTRFTEETNRVQSEFSDMRIDLKNKTIEIKNLATDNADLKEECHEKRQEYSKMKDQLESVQLLWSENQKENEKVQRQNSSLQKLNQELSVRLNEQRNEIKVLKSQLDESLLRSRSEIQRLKLSQKATLEKSNTKEEIESLKVSTEALTKIDQIICEIQSGFDINSKLEEPKQ